MHSHEQSGRTNKQSGKALFVITTVSGALREALKRAMRDDEKVFVMGEDIGGYGGIYNVTRGLLDEFGGNRVVDTPMAEVTIVGAGVGAAITGMRPVVEIMYADFLPIAMDQIINNAAKYYYLSGCETPVPMVIRSNFGVGKAEGAHQSQTAESWFLGVPGLKVVMPSNPADAFGLLLSSIADDNPVLFLEHKMLYPLKGELKVDAVPVPLSQANVVVGGDSVTVVSCGLMLQRTLAAVKKLEEEGLSIEVIDLRTLTPLDEKTLNNSVRKTGRLITVEENPLQGGWGLQVVGSVITNCFGELECPPVRLAGWDTPLPTAKILEDAVVPGVDDITKRIRAAIA